MLCDSQNTILPCETQLIGADCLNASKYIDALFLNFAKAFNKVSHSKLCHKLFHYGISGKILHWIKDILFGLFAISGATYKEKLSDHAQSSPVCYKALCWPDFYSCLICINDINKSINSTSRLYVDDNLMIISYMPAFGETDH